MIERTKISTKTPEKGQEHILACVFFAGLAVILSLPVFAKNSWLVYVQDDFLYYLKVAQQIAAGHGSTFNGVVATNGYQPLWLLVLVVVSWFTSNPQSLMAFLAISNFVAGLATFLLSQRLLRNGGVGPVSAFIFSALVTLYSTTLFFYGMEVTLTVPLMLGVICLLTRLSWIEQSWTRTFALGLLLSAMVLSRIDTLIFGGLILCGVLASGPLRRRLRADLLAGWAIGLLPVVGYFIFNHAVFHTWLPISGMAKELKLNHTPSIEPWKVFFHPLAAMFTFLILFALGQLFLNRKRFDPIQQVVFASTLVFPFVYYLALSCVSDWTLWGWYVYPIRSAVCISFVIILRGPLRDLLEGPVARAVLIVSVFAWLFLLRWTRQQTDIYAASRDIQEFAETHPGVYAMGDRAGRVAYLIPSPVIQTEGLMMDREYLGYVQRETPLLETLRRYNVRYYVATAYEPYSGCFQAVEPAKAGPTSAKMRATFCKQPEAAYIHDGIKTLIFDLAKY